MDKIVMLGMIHTWGRDRTPVFCHIEYHDGRLSISGVEGPKRNGDAWGSCGQIAMHYRTPEERAKIIPASGWTNELLAQFFDVWDRWHLNDMRAGSHVQEEYLRAHPIPPEAYAYPKSHYTVACAVLAAAGLNPDADGYRYGHSWKREDVPAEVITFLAALPESDEKPAWV